MYDRTRIEWGAAPSRRYARGRRIGCVGQAIGAGGPAGAICLTMLIAAAAKAAPQSATETLVPAGQVQAIPVPLVALHVDAAAPAEGDGRSWQTAFNTLQAALDAASQPGSGARLIRVAQGTYRPTFQITANDPRSATFLLRDGLAIRGGYAGLTHPNPSERNVAAYPTILTGDLAGNDTGGHYDPSRAENAYRVITISDGLQNGRLDGLTITRGYQGTVPGSAGAHDRSERSLGSLAIANCTIIENWAYVSTGGLSFSDIAALAITNTRFVDNVSENGYGGGLGLSRCNAVIEDCAFERNESNGYAGRGGAIVIFGGMVTLRNTTFTRNVAQADRNDSDGGAVFASGAELTINHCTFEDNLAGSGGALYSYGDRNVTITHSTFLGNSANADTWGSGGACTLAPTATTRIEDCAFIGNSARDWGAALSFHPWLTGALRMERCDFAGNSIVSAHGFGGGAADIQASDVVISDCDFVLNTTNGGWGGGLYIRPLFHVDVTPTVTKCRFDDNSAKNGGACRVIGGEVRSCFFAGNHASLEGGALSLESAAVDRCVFVGNSAVYGGAISATESRLMNSAFSGNTASRGGAVFGDEFGAVDPARLTLTSCTLAHNSASSAGGVYLSTSGRIVNSILWGNTDTTGATEQAQVRGPSPEVSYCVLQGLSGALGGEGNLDADPLLALSLGADGVPGTLDDDLHLLPSSPCINAGTNYFSSGADADLDGDPRIQNCRADIGADETAGGSASDCDLDGIDDACALAGGIAADCNRNNTPDVCDIAAGTSMDADGDAAPDECRPLVLFVKSDATGLETGLSWQDAFTYLQDALHLAYRRPSDVEIRVAAGTYWPGRPESGTSHYFAFRLADNIRLYGGFAGHEADREERDPAANPTVLSGDLSAGLARTGVPTIGAIVWGFGLGESAVVDGFTIEGASNQSRGGGVYLEDSSPTIRNCRIAQNYGYEGAGAYITGGHPVFENCVFELNESPFYAAGLNASQAHGLRVRSCDFIANQGYIGGGACVGVSRDVEFSRCRFLGNSDCGFYGDPESEVRFRSCIFAGNLYGGIFLYGSNCELDSCDIVMNADVGLLAGDSTVAARNSLFWGNRGLVGEASEAIQILDYTGGGITVTFSCIEFLDLFAGGGNIDVDPLFVDALGADGVAGTADDDFHLEPDSPCIDAGDPGFVPLPGETDIDGDARVAGARVDIGADEHSAPPAVGR